MRAPNQRAMTRAEREHSPPAFAAWLVDLARRTNIQQAEAACQ